MEGHDGEGGDSCLGNSKGKKTSATRRTWNPIEEQLLMDLLKELIGMGNWKTENGFRPGYLQKLERMFREKMPGTDIRALPHIHSRITIWKRHHGCLQMALGSSGSGFNTTTKIIDVSDIAWEKAVKREPSIGAMRYKPWPFYYDWIEVFGLDKASGKGSEDVIDAVNELVQEESQAQAADSDVQVDTIHEVEDIPCDMDVESQAPTAAQAKATTSARKKRAAPSGADSGREILDGLSDLFKQSDDKLVEMVQGIGGEPKETSASSSTSVHGVFSMLETIPDLSLDELLDASEILAKNPVRLEMFMGFPEHARPRYVKRLLDGDFDKL